MIKIRRPKLSDISNTKRELITSGCGCRGAQLPGAELFKEACGRHDMHYQAGTGWLFPLAAIILVSVTGSWAWLLLWPGEYLWANTLLLFRSLLEAEEAPTIWSSCWHVFWAVIYFLLLTLFGWATFSYTPIGWWSTESIIGSGVDRQIGENPRRSLWEAMRSWFGK